MTTTSLDAATLDLLTGSVRELFAALPAGGDLGPALDELGWAEVAAEDPATATTLLFTEQGRSLACTRALDAVLLAELDPVLPPARGTRAVLLPTPADGDEPSRHGSTLTGVLLAPPGTVDEIVVATTHLTDGERSVQLDVHPAPVLAPLAHPVQGFDTAGWVTVSGARPSSPHERIPAGTAWTAAAAAAQRALAAEILGTCDAALQIAVRHASDRRQFGRPIAEFQAVRHRLAEGLVALEGARGVLRSAWEVTDDPGGAMWAAALAKLQAGRAQARIMRDVVQVHGAMGVSREGSVHRYVSRAAALDVLLGGRRLLAESMGTAMLLTAGIDPVARL
jgi:hypothetical protein